MSTDRGFPATAACLRARADKVLDAWEREVRRLRGLGQSEPSSPALHDDIPELIEALARGLEPPISDPIPNRAPLDHALQRFADDVPLEDLVEEYRVLRSELFRAVAADASAELVEVWPLIANHIDRAIEEAVLRYGEQRARWLREREEELDAVLEDLPVGVIVAEATGARIVRVNREMARIQAGIAGARTLAEVAALGVEGAGGELLGPDELPLARALKGQEVGPQELRVKAAGGAPLVVETRARPIADAHGRVRAAVAIAVDLSERVRHRAERQLLAATLGHDVRSPLTTIRIAGQRLEQVGGAPQVRKLSGGIVRSAARVTELVTELLELSRSWERPVELRRQRVDLAELCREVVAGRGVADGAEIRLDAPRPVMGDWDQQRLARVLENLVENARKYGEPGAPIEVEVSWEGDGVAALAVTNRGAPIGAREGRHLFEPYARGGAGDVPGTGLGLFIVKEFVEAHGGRVELTSDPSFTTFRVLLPTRPDHPLI
jgi:signal transduction histidine kinase